MKENKEQEFDFFKKPETKLAELKEFNIFDYKSYIYSFVFYICGLIIGSTIYKQFAGETLDNILTTFTQSEFLQLFIVDFCLYFSIFLITVFLGFCMIGFPFVNFVPLGCGIVIGMKVAYYYVNNGAKGIVYCLLMVIPAAALLLTVITMSIKISTDMSRRIFDLSVKKTDMTQFDVKSYLKKYLIFAVVVALAALVNAGITTLFRSVITI